MACVSRELIDKIASLPPECLGELEDFVEFLCLCEREAMLARAAEGAATLARVEMPAHLDDGPGATGAGRETAHARPRRTTH